jgi:hypothetical protein
MNDRNVKSVLILSPELSACGNSIRLNSVVQNPFRLPFRNAIENSPGTHRQAFSASSRDDDDLDESQDGE